VSDPIDVIRRFWERVEARDWDGAGALLADDVEFDWPHTRERFRGRDNVIGMNRAYPEGWHIEVLRILGHGDVVVSYVRVPLGDAVSQAASVFEVRDGLIRRATELWVDEGHQKPPQWRRRFTEP
jgi:ketosteroid isomerase-like protein